MNAFTFGFGAVEADLWRLLFAMTRIGAALLAAPFFSAVAVPVQLRVAIAGALAVLAISWLPVAIPPATLSLAGLLALAAEVLVGLSLGFVLQLSFAAPVLAASCDLVFACGPSMSHLWAELPVSIRGAYAQSSADIAALVAADVRPGDVVMVKGSLGSRMALVVDALKARALEAAAG